MDPKDMRHDAPRPEPRRHRPGEGLFLMRRAGDTLTCELRDHGEFGTEAQFLFKGELLMARRFPDRALAVLWAESVRAQYRSRGWTDLHASA